jgi:hypothetical protein
MKAKEARALGVEVALLVDAEQVEQAHDLLSPVLDERTPFATLRRTGGPIGAGQMDPPGPEYDRRVNRFLERVAADKTEGGWVIIASALEGQFDRDLSGALARCRGYVIAADVWYGADIFGEGVVGQALVCHFAAALEQLGPWRQDANAWVRRAVGTGTHFWAKRSRGADHLTPEAQTLLAFLEPMFVEWDMRAVKGVGWGLKTLGRYYPDLVADWLAQEIVPGQRRHRALMLRKALTHLSDEQRACALGIDLSGHAQKT